MAMWVENDAKPQLPSCKRSVTLPTNSQLVTCVLFSTTTNGDDCFCVLHYLSTKLCYIDIKFTLLLYLHISISNIVTLNTYFIVNLWLKVRISNYSILQYYMYDFGFFRTDVFNFIKLCFWNFKISSTRKWSQLDFNVGFKLLFFFLVLKKLIITLIEF